MNEGIDHLVQRHYQAQAETHGASSNSTMPDQMVRSRESALIRTFFEVLKSKNVAPCLNVIDIGSGNGNSLAGLADSFPRWQFRGLDFSPQMLEVAQLHSERHNCHFCLGDARNLDFEDGSFEVAMTQRCLINILDSNEQQLALNEIHRVLAVDGYYLMIESFDDGLINNNKGREELGLEPLKEAYHNLYIRKEAFLSYVRGRFEILDPIAWAGQQRGRDLQHNFLSSHYFISRVVLPALTKREVLWNTEFVNFFSFLPPIGIYSCIQAYMLRKQ